MRIRAFHIEAFGRLRDLALEGLPPGMAIFLGQNKLFNLLVPIQSELTHILDLRLKNIG